MRILLLLAAPLYGEVLTGIIKDPSGAAVQGAAGKVAGSGWISGADGRFSVNIPRGRHRLEVRHPGFLVHRQMVTAPGPEVTVELRLARVDSTLTVTTSTEELTVDPGGSRDTITISPGQMADLPLLGRDTMSLLNEMTSGMATVLVDGMETDGQLPPAAAIAEVRINGDPYSAEYSNPGRSRIEIFTVQGTDRYHGSLGASFRESALDARNTFAARKPEERRRVYFANLTGPFGGNTFSLSTEWESEDLQAIIYSQTPDGLRNESAPTPGSSWESSARIQRRFLNIHSLSARLEIGSERETGGVGGFRLPQAGEQEFESETSLSMQYTGMPAGGVIHELGVQVERDGSEQRSASAHRSITVDGAFTGGGAQVSAEEAETEARLRYVSSVLKGRHSIRAGAQIPSLAMQRHVEKSNFGGSYQFSSLADYLEGRPYLYTQQQGSGEFRMRELAWSAFVQENYRWSDRFLIGAGLRYEGHNFAPGFGVVAPRAFIAFSPTTRNVIRLGWGIFFDRLSSDAAREVIQLGGRSLQRIMISSPGYPDPLSSGTLLQGAPASLAYWSTGVRAPYVIQHTATWERKVAHKVTATATYTGQRGVALLRSRDRNAPALPDWVRPDPEFGLIRIYENSASSTSHGIEAGLRGEFGRWFDGAILYRYRQLRSNADSANELPANSRDLSREWSRSANDERHRLRVFGTLDLPKQMRAGLIFSASSGSPYTITTGRDENRDGFTNDRPPGVARNTAQGPASARLDLRWSREWKVDDARYRITLFADAFNALNRVNYSNIAGNQSSPFFGLGECGAANAIWSQAQMVKVRLVLFLICVAALGDDRRSKLERSASRHLAHAEKLRRDARGGPEAAWLVNQSVAMVERARGAKAETDRAERYLEAADDLLDAAEDLCNSRGRGEDDDDEDRESTADRLHRAYFRVRQADYFATQSALPNASEYVKFTRQFYQQARAAYDERKYFRANRLASMCFELVSALENVARAAVRGSEPPRLQ